MLKKIDLFGIKFHNISAESMTEIDASTISRNGIVLFVE